MTTTKLREGLTDAEKFSCLDQYGKGVPITDIAKAVSRDKDMIRKFIQKQLKEMNTVRETNDMAKGVPSNVLRQMGSAPTKFLTKAFMDKLIDTAEVYAYHFAATGDNEFAIKQSGLDVGIAKNVALGTKRYAYRVRGQFIRNQPMVSQYIKREQEIRLQEYNVEKAHIQHELIHQVEELKELVKYEPRQRGNLLKSLEMLGRTIGSFTDRVEVEETDAKSGLDILMEKIKDEEGVATYESKQEEQDN